VKKFYIGGGVLAGLGVLVLLIALLAGDSPGKWIAKNYTRTSAGTFRASQPPSQVAARIAGKFRPADRVYASTGQFLRYSDEIVAVLADGAGSRITVDDPDRGYRRYYNYVGTRWGVGGRISDYRGGGPGSGK
jgi:hypothetical protein